jgi:hypothetical protein
LGLSRFSRVVKGDKYGPWRGFEYDFVRKKSVGDTVRSDPLSQYFWHLFNLACLVDVEQRPMAPTWGNERSGMVGISKHLNIFLLAKVLVDSCDRYRSWICSRGFSFHNPIYLQLE